MLFPRVVIGGLLALGVCLPAHANRIALVIGNDAYQNVTKLNKAGNDATAMARELTAAGFEVQLHRDLNYRGMVKAVETLSKRISGGDEVMVFFAGHGVQIKTGSYMLPVDIEATTESEVEKTAYGVTDLTEKLSEAKAAFALVVVDACRDNPLKTSGRSVGNTRGLSAIEPPKGQMVIYSASRGQQALDRLSDRDTNPNGVFTREFIAKMKKPGVKIQDLVIEVQDSVEALAQTIKHEQRPAIYNEARGNFYFYEPTTEQSAAYPPSLVYVDQRDEKFWEDAKTAGNKEAFEAYVQSFPKGRFVNLAKANIFKYSQDVQSRPEENNKIFPLRSIFESYLSSPHNYAEINSGTISGFTSSGSGVRSLSSVEPITFENSPALAVTELRAGGNNVAGQTSQTSSEIKFIYNIAKQRIGYTQRDAASSTLSNYGVIQNEPVSFPTSAKIGDTGNLWTMSIYPDTTKKKVGVVQIATWSLKAGVGSTAAILEIVETSTAPNNTASYITVIQYSIDSTNNIALAREQMDIKNGTTAIGSITYNFTVK